MNKFLSEIRTLINGNSTKKYISEWDWFKTTEEVEQVTTSEVAYQYHYRFGAYFMKNVFCRPEDAGHMRELFMFELTDAVYGDVKNKLYKLKGNIYSNDKTAAMNTINEILEDISC